MTQLDLQQRLEQAESWSRALSANNKLITETLESVAAERDSLQKQVSALAAENLALKRGMFVALEHIDVTDTGQSGVAAMIIYDALHNSETPATDAIKRQWMAEGLDWMRKKVGAEFPKTQEMCEHFAKKLRQPEEKDHE